MKKIVLSYINTNYRPKLFVLDTKICKYSLLVYKTERLERAIYRI